MASTLMRVFRLHRFGGSDVLSRDEIPVPEPHGDEILVRIEASSVNPVDYKIREGEFPPVDESKLPYPMGRDASGVVERCGKDAKSVNVGDTLFALSRMGHGTYADFVILKPNDYAPRPRTLDHAQAAAVPLAALTAWQGLFDHGDLKKEQRVLIHGGAGGVGHLAVQFARHAGAHVIVTAAGRDLDFVRELGADEALDYHGEPFEQRVKDIDVVFDLVGGDTQERSFKVLRRGGIIVSTLGEPSQDKAKEFDVRVAGYMAQADAGQLARVGQLIDDGQVRVNVARQFAMQDAAAAQDFLENEHVRGKVALVR